MTLGHVYDLDLKRNENLIKEVIIQAQGEVGLKFNLFMTVLSPLLRWHSKNTSSKLKRHGLPITSISSNTRPSVSSLGTISYLMVHSASSPQNIRGWDDLFNKCSENLNSLVAMKLSPYYKGLCFLRTSCQF